MATLLSVARSNVNNTPEARKRIKELLRFFEEISTLYKELRGLPGGALRHVVKIRGQLKRFFGSAANS